MSAVFDQVSKIYDYHFTQTSVGKRQRSNVWNYLQKTFTSNRVLNVLELNCGTGEDALFLAKLGHKVLATDVSQSMLAEAKNKVKDTGLNAKVIFKVLDISEPPNLTQQFDFIFSNFGGVNCLNRAGLKNLASFVSSHLSSGGHCVLVIMPQDTLMEKWYRKSKDSAHIFAARKDPMGLEVKIGNQTVTTYYHNTDTVQKDFNKFKTIKVMSVGYLPSYYNNSKFIKMFLGLDKIFSWLKLDPNLSDHYLIHLVKK